MVRQARVGVAERSGGNPLSEQAGQPGQDVGQPQNFSAESPTVRAVERAVAELQTARTYIERDLKEGRDDVKAMLQSLARLETKVATLPSKTWIGVVLAGGIAVVGTLVTIVYKIATGH